MGTGTKENTERNDRLVKRYRELIKKEQDGYMSILEKEFNLASQTIFKILRRRGVKTKRYLDLEKKIKGVGV